MAPEPSEQQWKITRSFARFAMEVTVAAMMSESASIPVASGKMRDISLGGMAVFLDPPVAVGQSLWLEFLLPQATSPMRLLCQVVFAATPPMNATGRNTEAPLTILDLKLRATASQSPRRIWSVVEPRCCAWIMSDLANTEQRPAIRAAQLAPLAAAPTSSTE